MAELSIKYPRFSSEFTNLPAMIENYVLPGLLPPGPVIGADDIVLTQGSCFAENLADALEKRRMNVKRLSFEEAINSPKANEYAFRYMRDPSKPFECGEHKKLFSEWRSMEQQIKDAHAFIFTLGLAPYVVWNGMPIFKSTAATHNECKMVFPAVEEIEQSLSYIVAAVREINPTINIILTVSPVPLNRIIGHENHSAVISDCVSKSMLRVAVFNFMKAAPENVFYWPSFEIVRWLGPHLLPVYGAEDGFARHVNQDLVDLIVSLFLKHYAGVYESRYFRADPRT